MLWQTGGIAGGWQTWRVDDSRGVSPLCVGADACIGPRYSAGGCRFRVISRSRPQCRAGDLARRLGACAAARFSERCKHCRPQAAFRSAKHEGRLLARRSSPADAGQGPAGLCRILLPQGDNAPLRLRLAAHPPPLAGEALGGLPFERLPCKGLRSRAPPAADTARRSRCSGRRTQVCFSTRSAMRAPQTGNVGVSRLRGAAHDLANTLPGLRKLPRRA